MHHAPRRAPRLHAPRLHAPRLPARLAAIPTLLALALCFGAALGQDAPPGTVLAEGFNGPMGVLVDGDRVLVIDSGMGGDATFTMVNPENGQEMQGNYGPSAQVVAVMADGSQQVLAPLPSIFAGVDTPGGSRLAMLDGALYATVGWWAEPSGEPPMELPATVMRIADGQATPVADLWTFESLANPDGFLADTHPYGLAAGPDGMLWVADAGANALFKVDPATGEVSTVAVFDGVPIPFPNPARNGAMETDPVPTGVVVDDDGTAYVSNLPGGPFLPGSARVMRVAPDGTVSEWMGGLTMLTDLRRGPDGALYAVQFAVFGEQGPDPTSGALVRLADGAATPVVEGLVFPTSVDFDADGNAYVTTNGVGAPGSGQLVRLDGVAGGN